MSVDYSARLAYGFIVDLDEFDSLNGDTQCALIDHDYYHNIDAYSITGKAILFGIYLDETDSSTAIPENLNAYLEPADTINIINEYESIFGFTSERPSFHLILQVW